MTQIFSIPFNNTMNRDTPHSLSIKPLTDSSGDILGKAEALPIYAANDSQGGLQDSTEPNPVYRGPELGSVDHSVELKRKADLWSADCNTLLTPPEAAWLMDISAKTLPRWRVDGAGPPYVKLYRQVRYRLGDLKSFLEARVVSCTAQGDALS